MNKIIYSLLLLFAFACCVSHKKDTGLTNRVKYIARIDSIVKSIQNNSSLKEKITHGLLENVNKKGSVSIVHFFDPSDNTIQRIIFDQLLDQFERYKFYYNNNELIFASYEQGDIKTKTKLTDVRYYFNKEKLIYTDDEKKTNKTVKALLIKSKSLIQDFSETK